MNYVHYALQFLIGIFKNTVLWLFNTEIINYNNVSISFGAMFLYFFIVYLVISFLLNARFGSIGYAKSQEKRAERAESNRQAYNNVIGKLNKIDEKL